MMPSKAPSAASLPDNESRSALLACSPIWPMPSTSAGPTCATSPGISPMSVPTITPTRGITLLAAVSKLSTSWSVSCDMSASESPRPVSQFCHDAFIMFTEPSMVVAASRAVVPIAMKASSSVIAPLATSSAACSAVMPEICIEVCMTSMAATMLSNDIEVPSTVTPSFFCTSVILDASAMSRCISSLVPP